MNEWERFTLKAIRGIDHEADGVNIYILWL